MHGRPAEIVAQRAEHLARGHPLVGDDQDEVTVVGLHRRAHCGSLVVGQELGDRRVEARLGRLQPDQSLGSEALRPIGQLVELVAPVLAGRTWDPDSLDRLGTGERLELGAGEDGGEFDEFHPEAQVGLVDTEAVHGVMPGHPLDGSLTLSRDRLIGVEHRLADGFEDVVLGDEAHLHVELHEFVLAVGSQILVAKTTSHLVVAVDAAHHQQLLEQLR
jgi:hypothetical protein